MPFRELGFRLVHTGGEPAARILWRNKTICSLKTADAKNVRIGGNVAAITCLSGDLRRIAWPATLISARGLEVSFSGARWRKSPVFPALLEYRHGFCALAVEGERNEVCIVAAGSPAATLALDPAVAAALPTGVLDALRHGAFRMRLSLAAEYADPAHSPGALSAWNFLIASAELPCIDGRGEFGDAMIWTFLDNRAPTPVFAIAGFAMRGCSLTVKFPFIPPNNAWPAVWHDDGLDYYVKPGLQIRPNLVDSTTKAVVKTLPQGGFLASNSD